MRQLVELDANAFSPNMPIIIALVFGLAGTFFLGIYFIHRIRRKKAILKLHLRAEAYRAASDQRQTTASLLSVNSVGHF
jgi:hypothetical protein